MLRVSEGWKSAHGEMLLPETFIEIDYKISEPGLQELARFSVTEATEYSNLPDSSREAEKHNSLEWNAWGLDGTFSYANGSPKNHGYVTSALCDESARFSTLPTITVEFAEVHTSLIPGVTILWSDAFDEWASSFRVTAYNGANIVAETLVEGNKSNLSTVWVEFQNFDKITIQVLEWSLPYRRCRTMYVFVGVEVFYTKANLLNYNHTRSVDMLSAALSKSEIVFSLDNSDDRWNPTNPTGAERYLTERQKVTLRYGMVVDDGVEWINSGTFWLSEWNTPSNGIEATFTARDAIQFMDEEYVGPTTGTLYAIASAALTQVSLDGTQVEYVLSDELKSISTSITDTHTVSEVLQMIAHMGCCVFYCDVDGVVHIEPRSRVESDYIIDPNVSYSYPEFTMSKPLKAVRVDYGEESTTVQVGSSGEIQTVNNKLVTTLKDATRVANTVAEVLKNRKTVSGDFRADPRVEPLDIVTVHNKYSVSKVVITDLSFSTTGGGLRGNYTGRVIDDG